MAFYVHNTLSGKKEEFVPQNEKEITMYSCGPTVYGLIHIGNLKAALTADLFYRYLLYAGYKVNYVRNYTDIDDKIINRANEEKIPFEEVTKKYISEVEKDYAAAGMKDPSRKTLATEHIEGMIEMISKLIEKGHAYEVEGEVLYSIESFEGYGKLSHKNIDDLIAGVRIEVDQKKRNPLDFTLWKPAKPNEPSWDSPWGKGRPGWHIECSVMASKWLGNKIDLHHGGVDLIFPHHENEIAQSEGFSGEKPFVKYWLHNGHLTLAKEKMSKSLGNVFLARDFLTKYSGEVARFLLLSVHYRAKLDFSEESMDKTLSSLERIYECKSKITEIKNKKYGGSDQQAESSWGQFVADAENAKKEIDKQLANDFNTAGALGEMFTLIREFNRILATPKAAATPGVALAADALLGIIEGPIASVIGIGGQGHASALKNLARIRSEMPTATGGDRPKPDEIEKLIQERIDARKSKDFAKADSIRDDLLARGVAIKDSPQGTTWSYS